MNRIFFYWAKTPKQRDETPRCHLLIYHLLDVAAVAEELAVALPSFMAQMACTARLEVQPDVLGRWVTFLLSLHDIGKVADAFQGLRPELARELTGGRVPRRGGVEGRHDAFGRWLLDHLVEKGERAPELGLAGRDSRSLWPWLRAAAGHHGRPVAGARRRIEEVFSTEALDDARVLCRAMARRFLLAGDAQAVAKASHAAEMNASWAFAGFAVMADWIGSNTEWFPFEDRPRDLDAYWRETRGRARDAVRKSGLAEIAASPRVPIASLWPEVETPTALQAWAEDLEPAGQPQLLIFEEVTGGGKTEAAILAAHRLLVASGSRGVYFALPTMATATAMHQRVRQVFRELFRSDGDRVPSLVLAHSRAALHRDRELRLAGIAAAADPGGSSGEDGDGGAECAAWLTEGTRRALLAHFGVGTIDQALLAVLPVRYQPLRLAGLQGKVLIVDEVHACDDYVLALLEHLLARHAATGGSAILLSATLPRQQRSRLVRAFQGGAGYEKTKPECDAYPLVTSVTRAGVEERRLASRSDSGRRVRLVRLDPVDGLVEDLLVDASAAGRCACWIRNTVGDAREAYERLRDRIQPERLRLLHSRFTVADRAENDEEAIRRFGKTSRATDRRGQIVVATQVVEQSLDVDFDVLVTDLAPVDLLIQRIGRLMRHRRDRSGNPIDGPDERGEPVAHVVSPRAIADAPQNWFSDPFPRARGIYPDHARLWLTARWVEETGALDVPGGLREAIEGVYGPVDGWPEALERRAMDAEAESAFAQTLAKQARLVWEPGYSTVASQSWPDDQVAPTRLGEASHEVRLLRRRRGTVEPWNAGGGRAWELSQLRVPYRELARSGDGESPAVAAAQPDRGRWVVPVVLEGDGGAGRGRAHDVDGNEVEVRYSRRTGLTIERVT